MAKFFDVSPRQSSNWAARKETKACENTDKQPRPMKNDLAQEMVKHEAEVMAAVISDGRGLTRHGRI